MSNKFSRGDNVRFTGGTYRGRLGRVANASNDDFYDVRLTDEALPNETKAGTLVYDIKREHLRKI
jgi:hypothetical protein